MMRQVGKSTQTKNKLSLPAMQLIEFYTHVLNELKQLYDPHEAAVINAMIFESMAGINKSILLTHPHRILEKETVQQLNAALEQLRLHVPVQYVIGHAWFYRLVFKVSPAVLVPRPETEELVTEAIDFIKSKHQTSILDIGTGSGCIAISIKKNVPHINVTALDISEDALMIAKENAAAHQTPVEWLQMNFLDENVWKFLPVYDAMISNPPYIPEKEKHLLDKNVSAHEPHLALFVPNDKTLIFYEKIARFGKEHLSVNGCIFMETHESYAKEVAGHFSEQGYKTILKKDFYEKERMVIATRCR
jgi:release factor glutamine methyltransferase